MRDGGIAVCSRRAHRPGKTISRSTSECLEHARSENQGTSENKKGQTSKAAGKKLYYARGFFPP